MLSFSMAFCHSCNTEFAFERVYRATECPGCGRAVKVCKNCRFFAPGAHWDCRETIGEPVREKDVVNFCDYFELRTGRSQGNTSESDFPSAPTDAFNDLFSS